VAAGKLELEAEPLDVADGEAVRVVVAGVDPSSAI
jgi:hypothetical protein